MREECVGNVIAHPMFDPDVEAAMDQALGKREGDKVYSRAFKASKKRAEAMLDSFSSQQHAMNSRAFRNALARFAAFAPEAAHELAKANPPPKSGCDTPAPEANLLKGLSEAPGYESGKTF
jgi:hypothetical protein